jgi:replicative DNA helicase
MTHTIDTLMALVDAYAALYLKESCGGSPHDTIDARCELLSALEQLDLLVLSTRPSQGKTAFTINMIEKTLKEKT